MLFLVKVFSMMAVLRAQPEDQHVIEAVIVEGSSGPGSCPSSEARLAARRNITQAVRQALQNIPCGGRGWRQVANLNMSDTSQQCPSPWVLFDTPTRSCSTTTAIGCEGISIPVTTGYSRVCGRLTGYALISPDAFFAFTTNIDADYLDGISLTRGSPRQHIWSFAAGHDGNFRCPCDNPDRVQAPLPPSFVGSNYYCDGSYNGALWDGQDCTSDCCTFNSPPFFTANLPTVTADNIEVRICIDQGRNDEAVHLSLLQLYVQ